MAEGVGLEPTLRMNGERGYRVHSKIFVDWHLYLCNSIFIRYFFFGVWDRGSTPVIDLSIWCFSRKLKQPLKHDAPKQMEFEKQPEKRLYPK